MDAGWLDEGEEANGEEADSEELRWRRRAALADEARRAVELEGRIDLLPFTLREASRAVDDVLRRLLDRSDLAGLSLSSLHVLVLARRSRPIVAIAHQLRVSPQAAGRLVKGLRRHGLVDVAVSAMDSRARLVAVTPAGKTVLRDLRQGLWVAVAAVGDAVGEDRLVALTDELAHLAVLDVGPRTSW